MIMFMDPQPVIDAVKALLAADSTLQGYLGASGRIYANKAPNDAKAPFIVVTLDMLAPDEMQQYLGEIRVYAYSNLLANGQIDPNQSRNLSRCEELLNNAVPTVSGCSFQPLLCLGVVPALFDPQDSSKSRGLVRLRLEVGKNG
jgi:hypothetical protein